MQCKFFSFREGIHNCHCFLTIIFWCRFTTLESFPWYPARNEMSSLLEKIICDHSKGDNENYKRLFKQIVSESRRILESRLWLGEHLASIICILREEWPKTNELCKVEYARVVCFDTL